MAVAGRNTSSTSVAPIDAIDASAYTIPTDAPESDGTLEWTSTTLVLAEVNAGGETGIGYTYADGATAQLIRGTITETLRGMNAMATGACWLAMVKALRNQGRPGIASLAVAAVDTALWDLKGRLANMPVVALLGLTRSAVEIYGSGGFTSYSDTRLREQLGGWTEDGIRQVKMKIGRDAGRDLHRVAVARDAIGTTAGLMVDANGAYTRKQALRFAEAMAKYDVNWFEEPVSSNDLEGLRLLRDGAPAGMDITAGEYGFDAGYFKTMLDAGAVDILQADATRCAGITGFMNADALCQAYELPLSAHCAPSLHCHPGCAAKSVCHIEAFHDHLRIEQMLFDGAPVPRGGQLTPDLNRPGLGLDFKRADALEYAQ